LEYGPEGEEGESAGDEAPPKTSEGGWRRGRVICAGGVAVISGLSSLLDYVCVNEKWGSERRDETVGGLWFQSRRE